MKPDVGPWGCGARCEESACTPGRLALGRTVQQSTSKKPWAGCPLLPWRGGRCAQGQAGLESGPPGQMESLWI